MISQGHGKSTSGKKYKILVVGKREALNIKQLEKRGNNDKRMKAVPSQSSRSLGSCLETKEKGSKLRTPGNGVGNFTKGYQKTKKKTRNDLTLSGLITLNKEKSRSPQGGEANQKTCIN